MTVCIVNHNNSGYAEKCVESVLSSVEGMDADVVVADNASRDGSVEVLQRFVPQIRLVALKDNVGYAGAGQYVYSHTCSKYFTVMNEDLVVSKSWMRELIRYMEANPNVAVAGCRIITEPDTHNVGTYSLIGENIWDAQTNEQFYVSGACLTVRRKLMNKLFDGGYFIYCEDVWVCWLARLKGYGVGVAVNAVVHHVGHQTVKKMVWLNFIGERNKLVTFLTFYGKYTLLKLAPLFLLFLSMKRERRQALIWVAVNRKSIICRRREIQSQRKLPDVEITMHMSSWVSHRNRTLNKLSTQYCKLMGIKTVENK